MLTDTASQTHTALMRSINVLRCNYILTTTVQHEEFITSSIWQQTT